MVIEIEKNIFKERDFKGLNFFIQLCTYKDRYQVYTEIDEDLLSSSGFKRLDYDDQYLLENNYNSFTTNQTIQSDIFLSLNKYIITTEIKEEGNRFTIDEAIRFFIQPLSIILENSKNDAYFINAILKHFATDTRIQNHIKNNWIQFENAGGCDNIINFIEGKKQSFNSLPKTDKSKYLKCFVLIDSDKLHPTERLKENKLKTLRHLVNNNIARHILRKRSIENYMPLEAIMSIGDRYSSWINLYDGLTSVQRDYFSIENGLCGLDKHQNPKKTNEQINQETNNLFDNILIEPIIGDNLISGLKHQGYGSFKENFPKLFELPIIDKHSLEQRANSDELESIVQKINNLL
jgi:hypothetical protein